MVNWCCLHKQDEESVEGIPIPILEVFLLAGL